MTLWGYDTDRFNFVGHVLRLIGYGAPLRELHKVVPMSDQLMDENATNAVGRMMYNQDASFRNLFGEFIFQLRQDMRDARRDSDFDFVYQRTPTVRFHFPVQFDNQFRLNDRVMCQHNDQMLGHPPGEINCWLPLTDCGGTAGLQLATLEDSLACGADWFGRRGSLEAFQLHLTHDKWLAAQVERKTKPRKLKVGTYLSFDGRQLHGPDENIEGYTRVSMDWRIMPVELYEALDREYVGTGRTGRNYVVGDVYARL